MPTDALPLSKNVLNTKMVKVETSAQLKKFIDFPHDLYANDPNYVPMIFMEQEALLNRKKSPFFKHSTAEYFLAYQNDKIVGRIAAIRNNNHINFTGKQDGFFGFFDGLAGVLEVVTQFVGFFVQLFAQFIHLAVSLLYGYFQSFAV